MHQSRTRVCQEDVWVPTICFTCVEGPCSIEVHRVDGIAVNVRGNRSLPDYQELTKNRGHVCPKPFGLIQKLYNPHRIKTPLKRTNPKKGIGVNPQWEEISWDEALNLVAEKLREARSKDTTRVCITDGPAQQSLIGTAAAFWTAFGSISRLSGGAGLRCDTAEHSMGNILHGGFQCEPDLSHCNYLLLFGSNPSASGGVPENVQFAEARARGMKTVLIDPVFPITGACVDEWLPIRPGTDLAFILAMIEVITNELCIYDVEFLKEMTNSPYLVGHDGYFVRESETNKVLIWDVIDSRAKVYDDPAIKDFAIEGTYTVNGTECRPAFQMLKEHVAEYTPEWASEITDISPDIIRRIAKEFVDNARIGSTISVAGLNLPYRPVTTKLGRGITGSARSYQFVLANHVLACLVGCLEVVGGHQGGRAEYTPYYQRGFGLADIGITPGPDGMTKIETFPWTWPPSSWDGGKTLVPYGKVYGHPTHLAYQYLSEPPKDFPIPPSPEILFIHLVNPVTSVGNPEVVTRVLQKIPFIVTISYVEDEAAQFADVVLPDLTDLEKLEPIYWMRSALARKFYHGILLRQPVVEPMHGIMDISDLFTELADRVGMLDSYNAMINQFFELNGGNELEPGKKYRVEDIADRYFKSATNGAHGLEWFKKNGALFRPTTVEEQYDVHLKMKSLRLRYWLPYMEHVKRVGEDLARNLASVNVDWWPTYDYTALPTYFPSIFDGTSADYDFYVTTCRAMPYSLGTNADIPWLIEIGESMRGVPGVLMNAQAAKAREIEDGDEVWIESEAGKVKGKVQLTQGIRPDTIVIAGQFGQWATPVAKDTGRVSQSRITPIRREWTDHVAGNMQSIGIKAKVYKE